MGELVHGRVLFAMAEDGEAMAANAEYMAKNFGKELQVWSPARVRETLATTRYSDGSLDPEAFSLHPLRLVLGTAALCGGLGGRIHEATPATSLARQAGARWCARRAGGLFATTS